MAKRNPTMSNTLADKLLLIADAEECRDSLKKFVSGAWSAVDPSHFVDGYCVDAICDHLTALTTGQIRFLLINIPPRHAKSTICSVLWPIWSWLHHPEDKFLCASYSLNLAMRDNDKKRNLINSSWFQQRYGQSFKLATESQSLRFLREKEFTLKQSAKRFFLNNKMGYQLAVSVGSTTTGEGGSVLSIDDAHSATEAHSVLERESAITWFKEVWSNRMNDADKDRMLVIGQRIHEEDISGVILRERPDWTHLNLPAEYEPSRHCRTFIGWSDWRKEPGELLWPERFSQETLERYKRDLGPLGYSAQYDQRPVPAKGNLFEVDNERSFTIDHEAGLYLLETPRGIKPVFIKDCWHFTTSDVAAKEKQQNDWTVFATWAVTPYLDALLIDVRRGHWPIPEQKEQGYKVFLEFNSDTYQCIYFEDVGYQSAIGQELVALGVPCLPFVPKGDKVLRASAASIWQRLGKLYFRKFAQWLIAFRKELYSFPMDAHDDQVDPVSMACHIIRKPRPGVHDESSANKVDITLSIEQILDVEQIAKEQAEQEAKRQKEERRNINPHEWAATHEGGGWYE